MKFKIQDSYVRTGVKGGGKTSFSFHTVANFLTANNLTEFNSLSKGYKLTSFSMISCTWCHVHGDIGGNSIAVEMKKVWNICKIMASTLDTVCCSEVRRYLPMVTLPCHLW